MTYDRWSLKYLGVNFDFCRLYHIEYQERLAQHSWPTLDSGSDGGTINQVGLTANPDNAWRIVLSLATIEENSSKSILVCCNSSKNKLANENRQM